MPQGPRNSNKALRDAGVEAGTRIQGGLVMKGGPGRGSQDGSGAPTASACGFSKRSQAKRGVGGVEKGGRAGRGD